MELQKYHKKSDLFLNNQTLTDWKSQVIIDLEKTHLVIQLKLIKFKKNVLFLNYC